MNPGMIASHLRTPFRQAELRYSSLA